MKMNANFMYLLVALSVQSGIIVASEQDKFRAVGKITEDRYDHTTKHEHKLKFIRIDDGKEFDIEDSPALVSEHCRTEKGPVVEVEGYLKNKFLFWGGNLVVTNYKVHEDIEVPAIRHVDPKTLPRSHPRIPRDGSRKN